MTGNDGILLSCEGATPSIPGNLAPRRRAQSHMRLDTG